MHPASAFNRESRRFSGLAGVCREAQARARQTPEGRAATARRNKKRWADPEYRAKSLEWHRARRKRLGATVDLQRARRRLQDIVDSWKRQGCVDCGYDDVRAIDPDHLDSGTKDGHVSRLVQLCASAARIEAELAKCLPRCARCHRRITQQQRPCSWRSAEKLPPSWRRRLEAQDRNDSIKLKHGCADCGWAEWPRGLDWDHVRGVKVAGVATLIANGRAWSEVEGEMAKCEVVCANCHRVRTAERRAARS
jgi:protein-arginine kinase activator protein McsA